MLRQKQFEFETRQSQLADEAGNHEGGQHRRKDQEHQVVGGYESCQSDNQQRDRVGQSCASDLLAQAWRPKRSAPEPGEQGSDHDCFSVSFGQPERSVSLLPVNLAMHAVRGWLGGSSQRTKV